MGHALVKNFRQGLVEHHRAHVESRSVEIESVNVNPVLGWSGEARLLQRHEVVDQEIDGNGMFPRVVLSCSREKSLREVESGYPEGRRRSLLVPRLFNAEYIPSQFHASFVYTLYKRAAIRKERKRERRKKDLEKVQTTQKVLNVASEGLQRRIRDLSPQSRYSARDYRRKDLLELGVHYHQT